MAKERLNELLDEIDNINWELSLMTIHQIHNTKRGNDLQDQLAKLRDMLKQEG